ncbi:MAG TPA: glycosyltransferase [Tepidisphaeraceae bacterium]|jgi:glycosyltransferase involved in cell wall biosynthesis|nr:glycosyltransferase [Tepidisphaeraceae bacterium]
MPTVSVILPAHNARRFLAEAVRSVVQQTFTDFECIVVDDGSTDSTAFLLAHLARQDERIKPIGIEPSGIAKACNVGLQHASGTFVARMDADDICRPERFARQVEYLQKNPQCVAVGSRVLLVDPLGSPLWETTPELAHERIEARLLHGDGQGLVHPAVMMRREAVMAVGAYRPQLPWAEDLDLFLRLARVGRLANLPDVLLEYRQHLRSVNRGRGQEQVQIEIEILREAHAARGLPPPDTSHLTKTNYADLPPIEQVRIWTGLALRHGNLAVARRHAFTALARNPLQFKAWNMAYYAARGKEWRRAMAK